MTLTHAPTLTISPALEALAVQLESRDEHAWQTLLSQVSPVFGDPIAAQVAHLMKTYKAEGEYDGELIRKMLSEMDAKRLASTEAKTDLATARPEDDVAEEAFEIEVDEVQWRGRTYLVADNGALFDDAHYLVGTWSDHAVAGSAPAWSEKDAKRLASTEAKEDATTLPEDEDEAFDTDSESDEYTVNIIDAAKNGDMQTLAVLLEKGADVDAMDDDGDTALDVAIKNESIDLVTFLIENGADINRGNEECWPWPPLLTACGKGNLEIVELLIDNGADLHIDRPFDEENFTLVMWATICHQPKVVQFLIDKGVDLNAYDGDGETVLDLAINRKKEEITEMLKNNGARTSSDIWFDGEQQRCLSMLDQSTLDKLNEMPEDERKEALDWLTEDFSLYGPLEPILPIYTPRKKTTN